MSLLTKFNVFEKEKVGYFVIKTSRLNVIKRMRGSHVKFYYIPAFDGAKPYLISDPGLAIKIAAATDAWSAMKTLRATGLYDD